MVPSEYGAVCLSACFMYLCKKIHIASQRIFVSARFFCKTAVLLWGAHWGAVSWIVLLFSCRADTASYISQTIYDFLMGDPNIITLI